MRVGAKHLGDRDLQARIHGLAFHGEHPEHALMDAVERLDFDEPVQSFEAEREHRERQRTLAAQATGT
jgi:hypothetical protein